METYYAPTQRTSAIDLQAHIDYASKNPVIEGLLNSIGGMLAIIDQNRHVIAMNDALLTLIGIDNPEALLGMRPGELLQCVHADKEPSGCGTTPWCSTCGLAIAIVASAHPGETVERLCALTIRKGSFTINLALRVKSRRILFDSHQFNLIFMQDITHQEQSAALERIFFHDVNNILCSLIGASEMLMDSTPSELVKAIYNASMRLLNEIAIQRSISEDHTGSYQINRTTTTTHKVINDLDLIFRNHPIATGKFLMYENNAGETSIVTDHAIVVRILSAMITNACEAENNNELIKVFTECNDSTVCFYVWNSKDIPENVALRIFQKNFSTRSEPGRGFGTFLMKYLGELILGGKVTFTSNMEEGTTFCLTLPNNAT